MLFKFDNEIDWHAARDVDITSTDLAACFGMSEYKSRLKLWMIKSGLLADDFIETNKTKWGRRLQIPVGLGICQDEGWQGKDLTGYYYHLPDINFGSSYDVEAHCMDRGRGNLEIKITEYLGEKWGWHKDRAPLHIEFQIQGQMHAAARSGQPFDWAGIAAFGSQSTPKIYFREYDAELGAMIDDEVLKFWQSVESQSMPDPDYRLDKALLDKLRPALLNGDVIDLSQNNRAVDLAHSYADLENRRKPIAAALKEIEDEQRLIETELHDIMGSNVYAEIGPYKIGAKEQEVDGSYRYPYKFRRFDFKEKRKY